MFLCVEKIIQILLFKTRQIVSAKTYLLGVLSCLFQCLKGTLKDFKTFSMCKISFSSLLLSCTEFIYHYLSPGEGGGDFEGIN